MGGSGSGSFSGVSRGGSYPNDEYNNISSDKVSGGASVGKPEFNCEAFSVTTTIKSPDSELIEQVLVNDQLVVSLKETNTIIASTSEGEVVGSIVITAQKQLVECIKAGNEYIARVVSREGGSCVVEISINL